MPRNLKFIAIVLSCVAACSYINGKGDGEKFVEQFKATHLSGAKTVTHHC